MRNRSFAGFASLMVLVGAFLIPAAGQTAVQTASGEVAEGKALIAQYCVGCHNDRTKTAGLSLEGADFASIPDNAEVWEKILLKLRAGVMPPGGRPRPSPEAQDRFVAWVEKQIDRFAIAHPNPGRVESFHRLNRAEYRNVIRDLLDLDIDVATLLPLDSASFGFDNMAGLKLSQALMERYLTAARKISRMAIGTPEGGAVAETYRIAADRLQADRADGLPFGTRGGLLVEHTFPQDAEYVIRVEPTSRIIGGERLEVAIDGQPIGLFTLERRPQGYDGEGLPSTYDTRVSVKAGPHAVGVTFLKTPAVLAETMRRPYLNPRVSRISMAYVEAVTITGPFGDVGVGQTSSRRRIFVCQPATAAQEPACARQILSRLGRRAYRRPVTDDDLRVPMTAYNLGRRGKSFEAGIERALEQLLVSPEFLFRVLPDPITTAKGATSYRLSDLELASRLSFFLWSSIPDDELLDVASRGALSQPAVLERQVRRMIADARSEALTVNFAGQWLQLRNLEAARPSEVLFPDFDDSLRQAFRRETELFFDSILLEDRSALDLLRADHTFVNERLARHYEIPFVKGSHFRRVAVPDDSRRGLLGHGSILTVTSHPTRTSPVFRGKWVLENILGARPPDPPPIVPPLPEQSGAYAAGKKPSMRELMARHRANAVCASCHSMIDPAGFALEEFDAIGRHREVDASYNPIDTSGTLPDGTPFNGVADLRAALLRRPERFLFNLTEKLLTYALGRGVEYYDMPWIRKIVRDAASNDYRLSSLIAGIVKSPAFTSRKVQDPSPTETRASAARP